MKNKLLVTSLAIITFLSRANGVTAYENNTMNVVGENNALSFETYVIQDNSNIKRNNKPEETKEESVIVDYEQVLPELPVEEKESQDEKLEKEDEELEDQDTKENVLIDQDMQNETVQQKDSSNTKFDQKNEEILEDNLQQQKLNDKTSNDNTSIDETLPVKEKTNELSEENNSNLQSDSDVINPSAFSRNEEDLSTINKIAEKELAVTPKKLSLLDRQLVEFSLTIKNHGYTIDTLPWGEEGYENTGKTSDEFINKVVQVRNVSQNGSYMQIFSNGEFLGWIDYRSFTKTNGKKTGMIVRDGYSIDDKPWGTYGYKTTNYTDNYLGENVTLLTQNRTNNYYFALKNNRALGWVDYRAFSTELKQVKNYILYPNYSIDGRPWDEKKSNTMNNGSTSQHLNKSVCVYDSTDNESYYFVKDAEGKVLGWVDHRAFSNPEEYQTAMITRNKYSIDDKPWGTSGYQNIGSTDDKLGETVTLIALNSTGNYYFAIDNNEEVIGWVDNKAFSKDIINEKNVIIGKNFSIDGRPWSETGSESLRKGSTTNYLYENVVIYDKSDNNSYYFVKSTNGETIGWIDYRAFINFADSKEALIIRDGFTIDSLPWGTPGFETKGSTATIYGNIINIVASDDTENYYLATNNNTILGWLDYRSVTLNKPIDTNYILFPDYSIDGRPWIEANSQTIFNGITSNFLNKEVYIYEVTDDGSYYFIKAKDETIAGWIDYRALGNKSGKKELLRKRGYTIDSLPWGTNGYNRLGMSDSHIGKEATILGESRSGLYSAILIDNSYLGWIDNRVFDAWLIYLDVGHGGSDPGTKNFGYEEKKLNLDIALPMKNKLEAAGYNVVISRTDDSTVGLFDRPEAANKLGADIFVSIHHNAAGASGAHGIETIYYAPSSSHPPLKDNRLYHNNTERISDSKLLAESIHYELIKNTGANDRRNGPFGGAYVVVRETHMPAVLLELGFMSNRAELNKLLDVNYQNILIDSIVKGINIYFD